jgi:DNA-binding LytR/AlgR family response regulator
MFHLIRQPFPFSRGLKKEILYICVIGVFAVIIFYFLRLFRFGSQHDTLLLLGFGLVSIIAAVSFTLISHFFYDFFTRDRSWTIGHEIIRSLLYLMFVGTGIMIYSDMAGIAVINLSNFFLYQFYTLLLGAMPVIARVILLRNWRLRKELQEALKMTEYLGGQKIRSDEKIIRLESPFTDKTLELSNHLLLYIEAAQNYIIVVWYDDKVIRKEMIRLTMKEAFRQISDPLVLFCHRSYMVNLRRIKKISSREGNAEIIMQDCDILIPLSDTYKKDIKEKLNRL